MIITSEMFFENNIKQIVQIIQTDYSDEIQSDFNNEPSVYPDLLTWLELHPRIVGEVFMGYIVNFGFTNDDIN